MIGFDARFVNWLRWCRGASFHFLSGCESLEHLYSGPQGKGCPTGWGDYDQGSLPRRNLPVLVDDEDGRFVNRVYIYELDANPRRVIKIVWFHRIRDERKAQLIGCAPESLRDIALAAKARFGATVAICEQRAYVSRKFDRISVAARAASL